MVFVAHLPALDFVTCCYLVAHGHFLDLTTRCVLARQHPIMRRGFQLVSWWSQLNCWSQQPVHWLCQPSTHHIWVHGVSSLLVDLPTCRWAARVMIFSFLSYFARRLTRSRITLTSHHPLRMPYA